MLHTLKFNIRNILKGVYLSRNNFVLQTTLRNNIQIRTRFIVSISRIFQPERSRTIKYETQKRLREDNHFKIYNIHNSHDMICSINS